MTPATFAEWEGIATELLDATGTTAPVDAFALAKACEIEVRAGDVAEAELDGRVIRLNTKMRIVRQHMRVAHELGHFALERAGAPDSEHGARHVGGALLMPWREMRRDLVETAWSIPRLRERHVHVSATALAIRITQLRDAIVTIVDPRGRKKAWRRASPHAFVAPRVAERVSKWERDLAARAYELGEEVRGDELCYAVPLIDEEGTEDRVLIVCELEQLSLRI